MSNTKLNSRLAVLASIIVAGALMRLIPHWPNFTPIAAMALFGGAYLGRKALAFIIPIAAMFLSDLILGFHADMLAVYIAFTATVLIGFAISKNIKFGSVVLGALSASVLFFLVTNFSAWLTMPFYTKDFAGLLTAYTAGLAFFNNGSMGLSFFLNDVIGTLFFSGVLFGAYYAVKQKFPTLVQA